MCAKAGVHELSHQVAALTEADLREGRPAAEQVVRRCVGWKARLVDEDPFDRGPRRLLNLGHTFGHALEALALPALLHGEAVGLGLLCAARLGHGAPDGPLESALRAQLERWALPTRWAAAPAAVLAEMGRDKKRAEGRHVLVVPARPGEVAVREGVPEDEILRALEAVSPA